MTHLYTYLSPPWVFFNVSADPTGGHLQLSERKILRLFEDIIKYKNSMRGVITRDSVIMHDFFDGSNLSFNKYLQS